MWDVIVVKYAFKFVLILLRLFAMLTTTSKTQDTCYGSIKYEAKLPCSHTGRAWSPWCCPGQWVAASTVLSARLWPPRRPPSRRLCPGTARSPPCGEVWWTWEWRVITHRVDRDNLCSESCVNILWWLIRCRVLGLAVNVPRVWYCVLCELWLLSSCQSQLTTKCLQDISKLQELLCIQLFAWQNQRK